MARAVARDWPVVVVQFLKSGNWHTGEEKVCRRLAGDWWAEGEGFTWDSDDLSVDQAVSAGAWQHAKAIIAAGEHRLVVFDDITYPINWGWIEIADVLATVGDRPEHAGAVLTGRKASADPTLASERRNAAHPPKSGLTASWVASTGPGCQHTVTATRSHRRRQV